MWSSTMTKRWFVTGTDTEVGKTVASCALLQAAKLAGRRAAGYKPVASGGCRQSAGLRNADALTLQAASGVELTYDEVNPFTFAQPTAPHIASREEGIIITSERLSHGLRVLEQKADCIIIEGAGGWYTPLSASELFAAWVVAEQLPVILVVGMKLGCINHALLTQQAIKADGLPLAGWIANGIQPPGGDHGAYLDTLIAMIDAPFLGEIPWLNATPTAMTCGNYICLP